MTWWEPCGVLVALPLLVWHRQLWMCCCWGESRWTFPWFFHYWRPFSQNSHVLISCGKRRKSACFTGVKQSKHRSRMQVAGFCCSLLHNPVCVHFWLHCSAIETAPAGTSPSSKRDTPQCRDDFFLLLLYMKQKYTLIIRLISYFV